MPICPLPLLLLAHCIPGPTAVRRWVVCLANIAAGEREQLGLCGCFGCIGCSCVRLSALPSLPHSPPETRRCRVLSARATAQSSSPIHASLSTDRCSLDSLSLAAISGDTGGNSSRRFFEVWLFVRLVPRCRAQTPTAAYLSFSGILPPYPYTRSPFSYLATPSQLQPSLTLPTHLVEFVAYRCTRSLHISPIGSDS